VEKPFVLLADDNEATCTLIKALLRADFVVDVASDGAEAIEKLKRRQYAAILLDLLMPVLDGYAVLDFLKEERADLLRRVLVVTASLSTRHLQRVQEYAVFGVISKPFEVDVLQAAVRQAAGEPDPPPMRGPLLSGGMILLLGELLKRV
jgi:CheY-like chemotaxis protein